MLGNNEDLKAKIADGTLSVQTYDQVKPQLKNYSEMLPMYQINHR